MSIFRSTCCTTSGLVHSKGYIISLEIGNIITFAHFEKENLLENKRNAEEDESILDLIGDSYAENTLMENI